MTARSDPPALRISLEPRPTVLHLPAGKEVPFTDAVLTIRNGGDQRLLGLVPRVSIRQEQTTLCEASDVLLGRVPAAGLAPGEAVEWGMYELLQTVDRGLASKIHLFGAKAALNWGFQVQVAATCRAEGSSDPWVAPDFRATFHWHPAEGAAGIGLAVEP